MRRTAPDPAAAARSLSVTRALWTSRARGENPAGGRRFHGGADERVVTDEQGENRTMVDPGKRLQRSRKQRMLAGVCGGIAEWLGWDATLVRVLYVAVSCLSVAFPGIIAYIILILVMPTATDATLLVDRLASSPCARRSDSHWHS